MILHLYVYHPIIVGYLTKRRNRSRMEELSVANPEHIRPTPFCRIMEQMA